MMFSWLSKLLFGPGKPAVACDQPQQAVHHDVQSKPTLCTSCEVAVSKLPRLRCPGCDDELYGMLAVAGIKPEPGQYLGCLRCGHVAKLLKGQADRRGGEPPLTIRSGTSDELRRLAAFMGNCWQGVELQQREGRDFAQARITWAVMRRRSWN